MDNTLILALSIGGTFVLVGFIFLIAGIIINNNVKKNTNKMYRENYWQSY